LASSLTIMTTATAPNSAGGTRCVSTTIDTRPRSSIDPRASDVQRRPLTVASRRDWSSSSLWPSVVVRSSGMDPS
jgi:hypothetical protein